MSAWIVDKGHIDILVNATLKAAVLDTDPTTRQEVANEFGTRLWRENVRSVNYRYNERKRTPKYEAELTDAELRPEDVLAAIHCYQYQACERPDWKRSWAYRAMAVLEGYIESQYPEAAAAYKNGRDGLEVQWGYTSLEQAIVVEARDDS